MVLRSDFHFAGSKILNRLVAAPMTELKFESLSAEGLAEDLVSEANAENRNAAIDQLFSRFHRVTEGRRISRTVRKKDSGWFVFERLTGGCGGWDDLNFEPLLTQTAQDVVFHSEI